MPEIMIPLIGSVKEFKHQEQIIRKVAEEVFAEKGEGRLFGWHHDRNTSCYINR